MPNTVKQPFITEKTLQLAGKGIYTFAVAISANKAQIAQEVEKLYHVDVREVRTITLHGKTRRVGRKMIATKKADWKKALVRLASGQKIEAFETTTEKEKK